MKILKIVLAATTILAAVYGLGRLFVSELSGGGRAAETAGVRFAAPPGFAIDEAGELSRVAAGQRLARSAALSARAKIGLHFTSQGYEIYWLLDRGQPAARLVELAAGPTGTRIETAFAGEIAQRLAWAAEHGRFDPPDASPGVSRNLYH